MPTNDPQPISNPRNLTPKSLYPNPSFPSHLPHIIAKKSAHPHPPPTLWSPISNPSISPNHQSINNIRFNPVHQSVTATSRFCPIFRPKSSLFNQKPPLFHQNSRDPEARYSPAKSAIYEASGTRVAKGTISTWPAPGATCAAPTAANGEFAIPAWPRSRV
jgi:hypothetical protein